MEKQLAENDLKIQSARPRDSWARRENQTITRKIAWLQLKMHYGAKTLYNMMVVYTNRVVASDIGRLM